MAGFGLFGDLTGLARAEQGVSQKRSIEFSGHVWKVKSSEKRVGPGPNYFSDKEDSVWVDETGRLHLKLTERDGEWFCAEVISTESFGYGTYRFFISTPLAKLDPNITLGLFTWSDAPIYAHREIDVECSKWGKAEDTNNAQFVVQPYRASGHLVRYCVPPNLESTTYSFIWQSNSVLFSCSEAPTTRTNTAAIQEWVFEKNRVPLPGDENARINLWLCAGHAPLNTNNAEIVVSKFEFDPLSSPK